jgi:hypothetical protein
MVQPLQPLVSVSFCAGGVSVAQSLVLCKGDLSANIYANSGIWGMMFHKRHLPCDNGEIIMIGKLALILTTATACGALPQIAHAEDVSHWKVTVINRSVTKSDVTVWDENDGHKQLLNKKMDAGQEVVVDAAVKGGNRNLSWKVVLLERPLTPGAKGTRCSDGGVKASDAKTKLEVSPDKNVAGKDC